MMGSGMLRTVLVVGCVGGLALGTGAAFAAGGAAKAKGKEKKAAGAPAAAAPANDPAAEKAARDEVAEFLLKPAEQAMKDRKYALAISLWRGVVAVRGDADDAAWKLAEAWTLAGEFDDAIRVLEEFAKASTDPAKKSKAQEEIASLGRREKGFGTGRFKLEPATKLATEAFKRGRAAFKKKRYELAAAYFKAGVELAPEIVGNYRELGESLDKLGRTGEANDFFVRYLRRRPFGKNADVVRGRLAKAKLVGKLTIESPLPCEEIYIEGQQIPPKTRLPIKDHVVAPGTYRLLCASYTYHHAQYEEVEVKQGASAKVTFSWAILENRLDPWGRVVIENPKDKTKMMDVGLWEEVGVPVPEDRRALKIIMTAGDGSKRKEEFVKLAPGQRVVLKW